MSYLPESIITQLIHQCHQESVPCISDATRRIFIQYLQDYQVRHYLEIGSAWGVSLFTAHQYTKQYGGFASGIERSLPNVVRIQSMIEAHTLTDITIHHRNANQAGWEHIIAQPLDMVFIDAAKAQYHIYLQIVLPFMAQNSVIICDDVIEFEHKLKPLYQFLHENQIKYSIIPLEDDDGILVIKL